MKRMFTQLTGSMMLLTLLMVGFSSKAQTTLASNLTLKTKDSSATAATAEAKPVAVKAEVKPAKAAEDTSWKPQRRIWGYAFGDLYYAAHTDGGTGARGPETNY